MAEQRQQLRGILKSFCVRAEIVDRCKDEQLDALIRQGYDCTEALKCANRDSLKEVVPGSLALVDAIMAAKAAGTKLSGTSPEAKTVEMVIPAVLHGDDVMRIPVTFNDEEDFEKYLGYEQCGGLIPVSEQKDKLVTSFAQLVPDGIYTHATMSKEAFARVLGEIRHLQQSREDEFARALVAHVQRAEPDQGYELRQDLRVLLTEDDKATEHDVVIKGKDKAYVGSHKTYAKGAKPVKEIAERCEELAKLPNELPAVVKPAFMVERVEPEAEHRIQKACTDLKVVRFQRSGHAIKVVNRMGTAGRLLRF